MYDTPFHKNTLSNYKFLITGGAGFIGSNLVAYLLKYNAGHVRVLDNLSNGKYKNIEKWIADYKKDALGMLVPQKSFLYLFLYFICIIMLIINLLLNYYIINNLIK